MKKKFVLVALACALLLSSFTGCLPKDGDTASGTGSKSDNSAVSGTDSETGSETGESQLNSTDSNTSSETVSGTASAGSSQTTGSQTTNTSSGTGSSTFKPTIYDLKGDTIRVAAPEGWESDQAMKAFNNTEKKFNCKFKFTYYSDAIAAYKQLVTSYMSGMASCEMFMMRGYNVTPRYSASGAILNLSKYYSYDKDPVWQSPYVKNICVWKGNRYGLTYGDVAPGYAIWYNKALFAAANVEDPWTYVNNGTWNWKTFRSVCKKLTRDTNGDGKTDIWAFNAEDPLSMFIITNGAKIIDTSKSPAAFAADSQKAVEAIEYYKMLFSTDRVVPDGSSGMNSTIFYQMETGKLAMFPYGLAYSAYLVQKGIKASNLGWVYWPKGNSVQNQDYIIPSLTEPASWVVPSKVSKAKEIVAAATYATAASWSKNADRVDQAADVNLEDRQKKILTDDDYLDILVGNNKKLYLQGAKYNVYTKTFNYEGANASIQEMLYKILSNQLSTSTALSTYKSKIQTLIKKDESAGSLG